MEIDVTQLAVSIITILLSLVSIYVIPYLKERYSKEQLEKAFAWAEVAVNAAEQLAKVGLIKPDERKDYAMKVLEDKGIKLDIDQLSDIIEAFVRKLPDSVLGEDDNKLLKD